MSREQRSDLENTDPSAFYAAGLAPDGGEEMIEDSGVTDGSQLWAIDHERDSPSPRLLVCAGKILTTIGTHFRIS